MVHGEEDYNASVEASNTLFNGGVEELIKLKEATFLEVFEGVQQFSILKSELENEIGIVELLSEKTTIFSSKSEARKMIQGGGVSINKQKVESQEMKLGTNSLINNKYLVIQKGKKNYYLCNVN